MSERVRDLDVVGIGSMVVDRVHRTARILGNDEKGILLDVESGGTTALCVGGVVLNTLGWSAALGVSTGIFGRQGDDEYGRFLRTAMDQLGIEYHIALARQATSIAEIFVDEAGGRAIYMAPGATSGTTPQHIRADHAAFIARASRLTTEVSQLPLAATLEALRIAREAGVATLVDLDVPPSDAIATLGDEATLEAVLRAADTLKPSKSAAQELVPEAGSDGLAIAIRLRERFGNLAVVVTDGDAGCCISSAEFEGRVTVEAVRAVDTTGCGDAFLGGLLAAQHYGLCWEDAGRLANACGAACALQLGAFPEDPEAARQRVAEHYCGPFLDFAPVASRAQRGRTFAAASEAESESASARVFSTAIAEISSLATRLDPAAYARAASLIEASLDRGGRVHVTGVGKPEHVARYGASLLASTGTAATFLHATEVLHGSLGQLQPGDVVIAISNSGETPELQLAVSAMAKLGVEIIGVTGNRESSLARQSGVVLDAEVAREGGPLELAPRASVAAEVLAVAALGAELQQRRGFTRADYAALHPAGRLGRRAALLDDPEPST